MGRDKAKSIVVADANPLERLGILAVLKQAFSCAKVDIATEFSALKDFLRDGVEILVMDTELPGLTSLEQLRQLRLDLPGVKFVLVSTSCSPNTVFAGLTAGAQGVIDKTLGTLEMVEAFRLVWAGHVYVPPQVCEGRPAADRPFTEQEPSRAKHLSARQRQVLELACAGISNKEIARSLDISEATVKVHATAAFRTLGVANRTHAAAVFRQKPSWLHDNAQQNATLSEVGHDPECTNTSRNTMD